MDSSYSLDAMTLPRNIRDMMVAAVTGLCLVVLPATSANAQSVSPLGIFQAYLASWVYQYWNDLERTNEDVHLARLPDMFGDSYVRSGRLSVNQVGPDFVSVTDVVMGSRLQIATANKAIPDDRVYFTYNHFHNAVDSSAQFLPADGVSADSSIDRYMFGFEKRFGRGLWSLELRMPLTGGYERNFFDPISTTSIDHNASEVGNLSAILKRLVYYDGSRSVAMGLGIETPTGGDFVSVGGPVIYRLSGDTLRLHPYVGLLASPNCRAFYHGFAQLDIPTAGNRLTLIEPGAITDAGRYNDPVLLRIDVGGGYRFYCNHKADLLTSAAALLEFHYTGAMDDSDLVLATAALATQTATLTEPERFHVANVTAGLHFDLVRDIDLRFAGAFPISGSSDRFFDSEVGVQLIGNF